MRLLITDRIKVIKASHNFSRREDPLAPSMGSRGTLVIFVYFLLFVFSFVRIILFYWFKKKFDNVIKNYFS